MGPLANDLGVADGAGCATEHAEPTIADLVAVAVGAVQDIAGPPVAQSGDVRQLVPQAGRDQHSPGRDPLPPGEERPEPARGGGQQVRDGALDDLASVARHLAAPGSQQLGGWEAVARQVAVHVGGGGVARRTGVHHQNLAAGARQDQGCGQARGACADDHHVVLTHASRLESRGLLRYERCCLWETGVR